MEASHSTVKQDGGASASRTFTEAARRTQIVGAAIEVIAESGYAKASFTRIAKQAGLSSTGMISYHFSGKDDLMREVVGEVLRVADAYMRPRIEAQATASGRLRAYIESNIALLKEFPNHLPAMVEVFGNLRGEDPSLREFAAAMEAVVDLQVERMREAQEAGEFGEFDPRVMVMAIRGAIDGLVTRAAKDPRIDPDVCGRELADLFERATRKADR
ncbi:TetR/AcrR family transcriptional regulator [Streptomyces olivoreticuli]|uniref:TetR/AcrR family transcriptional regulator n=1 Tax=Streptomyces olivoreticuli TaxID=68246 RepID=UPI002658AD04|nr:TetR/AcrR family transcriptional regulator [Streptomyces olivoreticuli]WKK22759.1 TetR/AcrR family transcriptional regulator [Streptomyces olivoreticuli]